MSFKDELLKWRGARCQKQVNDIIGIPLETYKKWEQGVVKPTELAQETVRWKMAADSAGVPVAVYHGQYRAVIMQVVSEILNKPKTKTT